LKESQFRASLICPECNFPMVLLTSKEARYPSGKPRKYYKCANTRECDVVCGAHPSGVPLGIPGNRETIYARNKLHRVFDQLWVSGGWTRKEAYIILQILTGLGEEEAHIACFNKKQCEYVEEQIEEFLELNIIQEIHPKNHFVNIRKECVRHGLQVHRVYLEGRQVLCVSCMDSGKMKVIDFIKKRSK
jgi:hypothetical protein